MLVPIEILGFIFQVERSFGEKDLEYYGPLALNTIYQSSMWLHLSKEFGIRIRLQWLMKIAPIVANFFEIDQNQLVENWIKQYLLED